MTANGLLRVICLAACLAGLQCAAVGNSDSDSDSDSHDSAEDNRTTDPIAEAVKYFRRFKYMSEPKPGSPAPIIHEDALLEPIKVFQRFANVPITGKLDKVTMYMMHMPRCGNPDVPEQIETGKRERRYAREENRDGVHFTIKKVTAQKFAWSVSHFDISPDCSRWRNPKLTYRIAQYTPDLGRAETNKEIQRSFDVWSEVTPLRFTRIESGNPDIELKFVHGAHGDGSAFDGRGNTLAHAFFPRYGGDVHMDEGETWTINVRSGINLFQVASHEIGHALGLGHSDVKSSLMAPFYRGYVPNFKLDRDDISGIQSLYGRAVAAPPATKAPAVPAAKKKKVPTATLR